jgi:hypothetical protein
LADHERMCLQIHRKRLVSVHQMRVDTMAAILIFTDLHYASAPRLAGSGE